MIQRMKKETEILHTVKTKKLAYFGNVIRSNKVKIQGKNVGKRSPNVKEYPGLKILDSGPELHHYSEPLGTKLYGSKDSRRK